MKDLNCCATPPPRATSLPATCCLGSLANGLGPRAIGVLLTGMGDDGAAGLRAMREAGAHTIAQDEATSVVYGMPAAAMALGAVDEQLPIGAMASRITALTGHSMREAGIMSANPSVLLIEDSDTQALLFTDLLENAGLSVDRVPTAEDGLESSALEPARPDHRRLPSARAAGRRVLPAYPRQWFDGDDPAADPDRRSPSPMPSSTG